MRNYAGLAPLKSPQRLHYSLHGRLLMPERGCKGFSERRRHFPFTTFRIWLACYFFLLLSTWKRALCLCRVNSRNRVSVGWGYLRLVEVISGRFRLVQVVSAWCCLRLIQVGSGWLRAQNMRPAKASTAIKCGGQQRPRWYNRIRLKCMFLTCRNVILTLQEKNLMWMWSI